jgi:hypothetical protein
MLAGLVSCMTLLGTATSAIALDSFDKIEVHSAFGVKEYRNVKVMGMTDKGVKIVHDGGIAVVPADALPQSWNAKNVPPEATKPSSGKPDEGTDAADTVVKPAAVLKQFDPRCLVFIKTDKGSGSGFIATVNGKSYVYTNAHVICGGPGGFTAKLVSVKTGTGRIIPIPYRLELSAVYDPSAPHGLEDMARFPVALKDDEVAYEFADENAVPEMGGKVTAFGNSLGGDVLTKLEGQILATGIDRIEVSCEIVPGNSGGPVVDEKNRVVGISTYADLAEKRDIWTSGTRFGQVRRFALRPEKVTKWRAITYLALIDGLKQLTAFDRDTLSLAAACFVNPKPNRGGFDVPTVQKGNYVVRQIIVDGSTSTLGAVIAGGIARVNQRLGAAKSTISIAGVTPVFAQFFAEVAAASESQSNSVSTTDRAPFLKQFIPQLLQERRDVHEEFVRQSARFR